jgi:3-deoxy-D-manno-octulosonic-acid transferase
LSSFSLKSWLARQAYSLVLRLAIPAYLWRLWSRGRQEPGYREAWPERLGFYGKAYRLAWLSSKGGRPVLWLHAVSLGETRAAVPLVKALRDQRPDMRLLLTHGTATGREAGKALLQPGDVQTWFPYDTPGAVRRFLALHRPDVGVLMETEVWPNVQHVALSMGVPMVLANARLSDKSLRQGLRLAALMRPAAEALHLALAQTADDARRLREIGVKDVQVGGNVKFDMTPAPALLALGEAWAMASGRPIVLAASTREGEEAGLLEAWKQIQPTPAWQALPAAPRLFFVPRHPQRFDEVATLLQGAGWRVSRRSTWLNGQPDAEALRADVWLGDSMGEMPAYYASARVGLLGGSFAPLGGQNLIEAAACGCPLIMGPSTFNFADAAQLSEAAGAAFRVADWHEGVTKVVLFCNGNMHTHHAKSARAFAQSHRGATLLMSAVIWSSAPPRAGDNK